MKDSNILGFGRDQSPPDIDVVRDEAERFRRERLNAAALDDVILAARRVGHARIPRIQPDVECKHGLASCPSASSCDCGPRRLKINPWGAAALGTLLAGAVIVVVALGALYGWLAPIVLPWLSSTF